MNFAECIIYSVNFEHFRRCNAAYDWDGTFALLLNAVQQLAKAGAEVLLLGANTAHIVADRIAEQTDLPLIDIRIATANAIHQKNIKKVGLLGTVYTMELDFYRQKLAAQDIEVITPANKTDREFIEKTLLHELGKGICSDHTREAYIRIANGLMERGAEGIVLGCTEIPLLIGQEYFTVPVFNTTQLHAEAAVDFALSF
ncbi:aspartate/glutamate racemase family protein [Panacibacter ginsenosidivorans]|uniref:aspartate/glutamate racemase family protein n=1 Tax=Panacibacter ginsenosidivorans TaxID=1813871 RepID=UPI001CEF6A4D|nr:amino acid racemase [Panacibacter ginsenosidivorans]